MASLSRPGWLRAPFLERRSKLTFTPGGFGAQEVTRTNYRQSYRPTGGHRQPAAFMRQC